MPSVHVATGILMAILIALRSKTRTVVFWVPLLVLVAHAVLDLIPHAEPSMFKMQYVSIWSWGFWWTATDILVAIGITVKVMIDFPEHQKLIWLCFWAAFGPDVVLETTMKILPVNTLGQAYIDFHHNLHWWKKLPKATQMFIGVPATFFMWWLAWKFGPQKGVMENVPVKSIAATTF